MKKVVLFLTLLVCVFVMGNVLTTKDYIWGLAGNHTSTAYTSPDNAERDYDNLVANHTAAIVFTLDPYRWNVLGLRFIVDDAGDAWVYDLFATKGKSDYFNRVATFSVTGGTQVGPATLTDTTSGVFCDTIAVTNSNWVSTITVVDGSAGNRMGTVWLDMAGYNTWALVATTVESSETGLVQITGY